MQTMKSAMLCATHNMQGTTFNWRQKVGKLKAWGRSVLALPSHALASLKLPAWLHELALAVRRDWTRRKSTLQLAKGRMCAFLEEAVSCTADQVSCQMLPVA